MSAYFDPPRSVNFFTGCLPSLPDESDYDVLLHDESSGAFEDEHVGLLPESLSTPSSQLAPTWPVGQRYLLGRLLGSGSYGSVCEAWDRKCCRHVAVKQIEDIRRDGVHRRILREVALLSHLQHPNIVKIYDLPERPDPRRVYIVMERCDTDLSQVCSHACGLSFPQARKLACGLVVGCRYLHSVGVYHRDLKPANCLASRDCTLKICDFNLARSVEVDNDKDETDSLEGEEGEENDDNSETSVKLAKPRRLQRVLSVQVATRPYRAPEVILTLKYTEAMDVWAAGCIIAELFMALNTGDRIPQSGPLFRGHEAYPLSQDTYSLDRSGDQLDRIFDVLGTPSDEELDTIPYEGVRQHVRAYTDRIGTGLCRRIPVEATQAGLHLLEGMIVFLHEKRMSMQDAVAHQFFEPVQGLQRATIVSGHLDLGFDESSLPRTATANIDQLQKEIDSFRCMQD